MTPLSKKVKTVKAWAIYHPYDNKLCHWAMGSCAEQYDIFVSKKDAEIAKDVWDKNDADGHYIVQVLITPLPRRK